MHAYSHTAWEVEIRGSEFRGQPSWAASGVRGEPWKHEILSQPRQIKKCSYKECIIWD